MDIVLKELFGSDIGLLSLFTIAFVIAIAIFLFTWVMRKMNNNE